MRKLILVMLALSLAALACSGSFDTGNPEPITNTNDAVATSVAATLAAEQVVIPPPAEPTVTQPVLQSPETGTVSGAMCYPSEGIPPMTLYLEEVNTQALTEVAIAQDQGSYSVDVPPGNYTAYAWLPDFGYGGSYSQAVPCGLDVSCTDHSLINFNVTAGQTTENVDICDWYGDPGSIPLPPNVNPEDLFGSISGTLSYPSEGIPPLVVVAYDVNSADYYFVLTQQNQGTFTIDVPAGSYHVYAYIQGDNYSGAYNQAVLCGLSVECTDATMIDVFVNNNQDVTGIDPGDWYSNQDTRPSNPNN